MDRGYAINLTHERAIHHFVNKEYSEAEFLYRQLCHKQPDSTNWLTRGLCFKFMEMYSSAIYCFHQSLKMKKNEFKAHYHLGTSFLALHDYKRAVDYLNRAAELEPTSDLPYYMKGLLSKYIMKS